MAEPKLEHNKRFIHQVAMKVLEKHQNFVDKTKDEQDDIMREAIQEALFERGINVVEVSNYLQEIKKFLLPKKLSEDERVIKGAKIAELRHPRERN